VVEMHTQSPDWKRVSIITITIVIYHYSYYGRHQNQLHEMQNGQSMPGHQDGFTCKPNS
jgi:hypothetical protein